MQLPPNLELVSVGNVLFQVAVDPSKEWRAQPGCGTNKTLCYFSSL